MNGTILPIFLVLFSAQIPEADEGHTEAQGIDLEGPYLGQTPPGSTPQSFAPGIVNTEDWGDGGHFSLDMTEFYIFRWRPNNGKRETQAITYRKMNNQWRKIANPREQIPFFAPDGKRLYYKDQYQERTASGWSELKSLGPAFEEIRMMSLAASKSGTLVLDEIGNNGDGLLRYSRIIDGKRELPKPFGPAINSGRWNGHPYIAPDDSYIMWSGEQAGTYGKNDLYISFQKEDGSWGKAINMGDKINTDAEEGAPRVTPDGKYIMFGRSFYPKPPHNDLYWVSAQVIEELRPQK
jgi:Tol biopolymer transport system component